MINGESECVFDIYFLIPYIFQGCRHVKREQKMRQVVTGSKKKSQYLNAHLALRRLSAGISGLLVDEL